MLLAALYDIHGNLPALEAVLEEVRRAQVDQVVVGGDVFPGPMSGEALELLLALDLPVRFIRGNGDRAVLALAEGGSPDGLPAPHRAGMEWVARRLDAGQRGTVARWPMSMRIEVPELGDVMFCHATPRSDSEIFTRLTPEERLLPIFEDAGAGLVVCGHTHMQFDRRIGEVRVVNAGSVGMPFGDPEACWALLGPEVQLQETAYDLEEAAARIRATDYPEAEEFAARGVLSPRSQAEMLEVFTAAEIR